MCINKILMCVSIYNYKSTEISVNINLASANFDGTRKLCSTKVSSDYLLESSVSQRQFFFLPGLDQIHRINFLLTLYLYKRKIFES